MPLPNYLTAAEAADILRVAPLHVMRLCREGKLPAARPGKTWLITEDDLADYIASGKPTEGAA